MFTRTLRQFQHSFRTELQRAFFPPTFQDVEPTAHLEPGDERMWTSMKIFVELRDDTTFYIPFREASKNWQWDGHDHASQRPRKRESASIHLTAGDSSSISYFIPMVASATGYESRLEVHLDDVKVTSSLNDIRLLNAESCRIRGELPSPLNWDAPRDWTFAISLRQPVVYLLRDHINMFTDLGKDWSAGPPTDWYRFVPVVYVVQFELHHYEINLYVNDHNIIDKPLVKEENGGCPLFLRFYVVGTNSCFQPFSHFVGVASERTRKSRRTLFAQSQHLSLSHF